MTDKIKGIVVMVRTDKGLYKAVISDEVLKIIYKLLNTEKIVLVEKDLTELLTKLSKYNSK